MTSILVPVGFRKYSKAPFIWRKVVPGKRVTLPAESTLASVYMRKKLTLLPEPRADRLEIMKTCEKKNRLEVCKSNRLFFLSLQTLAFYTQEILVPMVFETKLNNSEVKTCRAKSVCEGYTSRG